MKPQKKRSIMLLTEPLEHVSQRHFSAALHGSLAALPGFLPMKSGVVDIEAALESGGKAVFRVEDNAADKRACVVALGVKNIGQKGNTRGQAIAKVAYAVVLGESSGEDGGVRNRRDRRLGVRMLEHRALTRQCIQ